MSKAKKGLIEKDCRALVENLWNLSCTVDNATQARGSILVYKPRADLRNERNLYLFKIVK